MSAHLSAVPDHAGAVTPGEATKWPWHLTNADVIVRDPHNPKNTGAWPVIGEPNFVDGVTVVYCETEDHGGEGVFVYRASEQATVRAGTTYTLPALYSDDVRDEARRALSCGDRYYIVGRLRADFPEVFDHLFKRLVGPLHITATTTSQEAGTP